MKRTAFDIGNRVNVWRSRRMYISSGRGSFIGMGAAPDPEVEVLLLFASGLCPITMAFLAEIFDKEEREHRDSSWKSSGVVWTNRECLSIAVEGER